MLQTGVKCLDEILDGIKENEFVVIASKENTYTFLVVQNITYNMATKKKGLYFNLNPNVTILEPVKLITHANITIEELREICQKEAEEGLDFIVVDDFNSITSANNYKNTTEMFSNISRILKTIALELKIPVITLCKITENAYYHERTNPRLRDLDADSSIVQDADKVIFAYWGDSGKSELKIAKNRYGKTGVLKLSYSKKTKSFYTKKHHKKEGLYQYDDWFSYDWVINDLNKDFDIECMDRIGVTDDGYEVFTITDDYKLSSVPHFHYRKKEKGKPCLFHTCIRFDKPEYYYHTGKEDALNETQKDNLIKFLRKKRDSKKYNWTYWEQLIMSWNHQNNYKVCVDDLPMPDYMELH